MAESVKNVLIVEDNEFNMLYLTEVMSSFNFNLICATNGYAAVEKARENELALVLMDMKLPEMGGFEAAKEIKKLRPEAVIIAQTAYMLDSDADLAQKIFDGYLIKPINKDQLSRIVDRYLTDKE
ncbi:MAG: response regulator [Bacteroidales bacterium]|nr:response regulator [Bacteroidales bacterium]MBO7142017.1 response regulator [Bacteroidales bacterium]